MESKIGAEMIETALREMQAENGHLREVLRSFGKTLIEQARWRTELHEIMGRAFEPAGLDGFHQNATPDSESFEEGVPITNREHLVRLGDLWHTAAERLIPSLLEGFPAISEALRKLRSSIATGFIPHGFLEASFRGRTDEALTIALREGIERDILFFALNQLAKPVVQERAEMLAPRAEGLSWNRGYCFVCGSFPGMSFLWGKEGQRWLRCGFCSSTWRFHRTACPFCGTHDLQDREIFFVEGREYETSEACHKCGRYINSIDTRNMAKEPVQEVMDLSLMHLDIAVQKKGFKLMKGVGWKNPANTLQ